MGWDILLSHYWFSDQSIIFQAGGGHGWTQTPGPPGAEEVQQWGARRGTKTGADHGKEVARLQGLHHPQGVQSGKNIFQILNFSARCWSCFCYLSYFTKNFSGCQLLQRSSPSKEGFSTTDLCRSSEEGQQPDCVEVPSVCFNFPFSSFLKIVFFLFSHPRSQGIGTSSATGTSEMRPQ